MNPEVKLIFVDEKAANGDLKAQEALFPKKASLDAAGFDLVSANHEPITLLPMDRALIPTGIAIALPNHFEAQIRPRSGLALKSGITVLNTPGTIDADYRGEIKVLLINFGKENFTIQRGMRIAQMIIAPVSSLLIVKNISLDETQRNVQGFGSTGLTC